MPQSDIRRNFQRVVLPVTNVSARDVEGLLGVVAEAAAADGDTPFDLSLINRLTALVPADHAGYFEYGERGGRSVFLEVPTAPCGLNADEYTAWVSELVSLWPLNDAGLRESTTATKFSDFVSERGKRRDPWYSQVMRPWSQEHECKVLLPSTDGEVRGFFFVRERGRRDFEERDRAVLTLLRLQLGAICDRWHRRQRPSSLTAREAEIVRLVRDGLTNQEIADRLVISTGTVRAHLERIFEKLGVHTRTAAVARAFGR